MLRVRLSVVGPLLALSVGTRLIPYALSSFGLPIEPDTTLYPWNFSPILPLCILGAAVYANPGWAYLVPLATYALGDVGVLALTGRTDWAFYAYQPAVYTALVLVVSIGFLARYQRTWCVIAAAGIGASLAFFVVTNLAVWALGGGRVYPLTAAGLVDCYVRALPFFTRTVVSMAIFLPILFSRVGLMPALNPARRPFAAARS